MTVLETRSRASRAAVQPKLAQFLGEFQAGSGPIASDVVTQLLHVAFDVKLVLLEPGDIELLAGGTALELTRDVFFVITNNPRFWNLGYRRRE